MKSKKLLCLLLLLAAAAALLTGCGRAGSPDGAQALPKGAAEDEILTLTPVDQGKELVTIHYEYGLDIVQEIENVTEARFPNVDVVMVHDGANNSVVLLDGNLREGTACDLIFSRFLPNLERAPRDCFLDLSGEAFINNFYLTSLEPCIQPDNRLYYLPGPANLFGIIYDKTAMEENGWAVPTNYSEFVALIDTIDHSGLTVTEELDGVIQEVPVRAIRPSMAFTDSFRIQLYPYVYQQVFAGQKNLEWLLSFQNGEGSLLGHLEPLADAMKQLLDDGVLHLEDWDYMPRHRLPMLCTSHSTVMIFGPVNSFANATLANSDHEYAILPIFAGDGPGSDYLYSVPTYYMAINKASAAVSPHRKQLLLDILAYICEPETQSKLYGTANTIVSNIKSVAPDDVGQLIGIQKTIREGRIITDFSLDAEAILNEEARDMLTGKITVEQWLRDGDRYHADLRKGVSMYDPQGLGTCEQTLSKLDTALLMGRVYRDVTGADIGLVYVNLADQGANCRVFAGALTTQTVRNIAPDRTSAEGEGLACSTLTGRQIMACLSGMPSRVGHSDNWYYVASGLNVEFAPWMPAGQRLVRCTLPDGTALDPDAAYTVAFMSDRLFCMDCETLSILRPADEVILPGSWMDHFTGWFAAQGGVLRRPEQTTTLNWMTPI